MAGFGQEDDRTPVGHGLDEERIFQTYVQDDGHTFVGQPFGPEQRRRGSTLLWVVLGSLGLLLCVALVGAAVVVADVPARMRMGLAGLSRVPEIRLPGAVALSTQPPTLTPPAAGTATQLLVTSTSPATDATETTAEASQPGAALTQSVQVTVEAEVTPTGTPELPGAPPGMPAQPQHTPPHAAVIATVSESPTAERETATADATAFPEPAGSGDLTTAAAANLANPQAVPVSVTDPSTGALQMLAPPAATQALSEVTIGAIVFASGASADGQPVDPGTTFSGTVTEIHAFFSYQGMENGMSWERRWYRNGNRVGGGSGRWDAGAQGAYHLSLNSGGQPLGAGSWKLEIYVADQLQQSDSFVVEAAAAPAPTAKPSPTAVTIPTLVSQTEAPPTVTPVAKVYKIVFARWDGGTHNLYVADTTGGGEKFLLHRAAGPSWSPDGKFVAFYGEEGVDQQEEGNIQLAGITNGILYLNMGTWSADLSHAELGQFVREGTGRWAAWAPDGTMVAFDAARGGPDRRIYFLGTADNQQYNVEIPGEQADWSPDSDRLVYRSGRDNQQGIWISNRDGSGSINITTNGNDAFPRWSPDGRKIAFHRESDGNVDIYVMNVDGSNIRRLTDTAGPDTLPAWTPDGRIVFRSVRNGSWGIYIMNADSSDQKLIIPNADPGSDWAYGHMDVH